MSNAPPEESNRETVLAWSNALHQELREQFSNQRFRGRRPSIRIHQTRQHWGSFDPLNHEITISLTLIEECPWWVVVEILKHEIAHLFVHAAFPDNEAPHNHRFQAACASLDVASWARRATIGKTLPELRLLYDWRSAPPDKRTEKYRERLKKFLALASSTNEHEALVAMRRARELQDRHRLEDLDAGVSSDFINLEIGAKKQRHAPYQGRITSILINHYHVEVVFISRYNAKTMKHEATIDIMGRPEDVLVAEYVHVFLHQSAETLWQRHRKESGAKGLRARNSFIRGLLVGLHDKLDQQRGPRPQTKDTKDTSQSEKKQDAMVVAEDHQRKAFKRQRYPRLSTRSTKARVDMSAYSDGKREGGRLNIRQPIGVQRGDPKLLSD